MPKNPHVYFVSGRADGCYWVRCLVPMRANGWDGDRVSLRSKAKDGLHASSAAMRADVVVFQRPDDPRKLEVAKMLKSQGKTIVFDNDDTYIPDSGIPTQMESYYHTQILEKMNKQLYDFIEISDIVTTTTEYLADEYRKIHDNVKVLPNMIDPMDWYTPKEPDNDVVRIGFTGSVATAQDYTVIENLIKELSDDPRVQIVLHAIPPATEGRVKVREAWTKEIEFWNQIDLEWHYPSPTYTYPYDLNNLNLDMLLIPRHDSYFNRCKSNIKYLEASMCEIPVIAQGFDDGLSPYQLDPSHMIIANKEDEWREAVYDLIENKEKRREMAKNARQHVLDNYNINDRYHEFRHAYQEV